MTSPSAVPEEEGRDEMRWLGSVYSPDHPNEALAIITWIRANGGEAQWYAPRLQDPTPARILIRQRDGSDAVCEPGQWVVKGEEPKREDCPHRSYLGSNCTCIREFTVEDR